MSISRRRFLATAAAPLALPLIARPGDEPPAGGDANRDLLTPDAQRAIDRGLEYLAQHQHNDGSWGEHQYNGNIAVTSLAALAFMAGGNQPGRGHYGKNVEKAIEYVLSKETTTPPNVGFLFYGGGGSGFGAMYSHGFGTLLLGEAYGMVSNKDLQKRVRGALERAVALIVKAQNKDQGGWRYDTTGTSADVSVTICQIMALRSARNAGLQVPKSTVEKCIKYVKDCQNDSDGGFNYMKGQSGRNSAFPRSAAGVVALYCAGIYEGREIEKGLNYLMQFKPNGGGAAAPRFARGVNEMHYYYGQYYAAQAMWTAGGRYWQEWFPAIREELLQRARMSGGNGSWSDPTVCTDYATAMACIILQIPNNYLPIMQK
jgi:prenyltransferase beta subunit